MHLTDEHLEGRTLIAKNKLNPVLKTYARRNNVKYLPDTSLLSNMSKCLQQQAYLAAF
jgi:hypothetical protein